MIEDEILLK